MDERLQAFGRLLKIMDELREQCPWDSKQTLESLRYLTIEEVYELSDAILEKDMPEIAKELGDLFLHLVFYSRIGSEHGAFDVTVVLNGICDKLIHRHPHIYGDVKVNNEEDVKSNWEKIKLGEGRKSVLGGVPTSLPAMVKAYRIQEKARGVGFDWNDAEQVWAKVSEEILELQKEVHDGNDPVRKEDEFWDLLFALINYSRFIGVNPEDALERTNKKFIRRFRYIEDQAELHGRQLTDMSLAEMDEYWTLAKKMEWA
ncbi:MAG TPA: nucleoside triphosphate pyrophosphohydrolase [Bacteroidales bacterium]|nr:nucleoside triphosphate pyrophosphohydrolase [Bacteroidales bacterium]